MSAEATALRTTALQAIGGLWRLLAILCGEVWKGGERGCEVLVVWGWCLVLWIVLFTFVGDLYDGWGDFVIFVCIIIA